VQAVRRPGRRAATVLVVFSGGRRQVVVAAVRRTFAAAAGLLLLLPLAPGPAVPLVGTVCNGGRATVASDHRRSFCRLVCATVAGGRRRRRVVGGTHVNVRGTLFLPLVAVLTVGGVTRRARSTRDRSGIGAGGRLWTDSAIFAAVVLLLWLDRGRR